MYLWAVREYTENSPVSDTLFTYIMTTRKIEKSKKNGNYVCPHCGSDSTYRSSSATKTTEGTQLFPYRCDNCLGVFSIEMRNGKAVEESEL